jgi:menaquinone-dependent protoporphyrinogen oxidase
MSQNMSQNKSQNKSKQKGGSMKSPVLVTYVTRYGSTQQVAETIAARLREDGMEVELKPIHDVESLEPYHAIVFGAPLYIGRWPREVHLFLSKHRDALVERPTMIFTMGPIHADPKEFTDAHSQLALELAKYPWLNPEEVEIFGGVFDPAKMRFPDNLLTLLPVSPLYKAAKSDVRDEDAIRAWADKLVVELQGA